MDYNEQHMETSRVQDSSEMYKSSTNYFSQIDESTRNLYINTILNLFEILNELESENMIVQYNNSHKSLYLTKEGVAKAEKLKEKYF